MAGPYAMRMRMVARLLLVACLSAPVPAVADAAGAPRMGQDSGQGTASARRQRGQNLPVREIERRVVPRMAGAQYLGFDYDPGSDVYTLKFLRNGSVIWVDVEGSTGRILRRTGS
jgi:hypothetical protein